jgi:4-hydroxy-tetrahydrodipicolinate synthase
MSRMNYHEVAELIQGPVFPVVTPFKENGDVDYEGLERYLKFLVKNGAESILVTVGTSRFNLLTREEMKRVNEVVSTTTEGEDVCSIVSGPGPTTGSTEENIEFARHAESVDADAIILSYPERWYGKGPVVEFFGAVDAETEIPLIVHAVPMRDGFGGVDDQEYFTVSVLEDILDLPAVIGVKEESGKRELYESILVAFEHEWAIIGAGGAMDRYLTDSKLGATTYLVGIGSFLPDLALQFFDAVQRDKHTRAREIASNEEEYFEIAVEMGWHRALKETLHQMDLMKPYERDPLNRVPENDRARIARIIDSYGWTV